MDWALILLESVWMSIAFCAVMTVFVVVGLLYDKEMFYQDYPADVKAKWGPISEGAKKKRNVFASLLIAAIVGVMAYVPFRLTTVLGQTPNFLTIFVTVAIINSVFNLFDAFIIDWLMLMKLWPSLGVLPGTEGMAGYTDMKLWTVNLFKGVVIAPTIGLIAAAVASLVIWIASIL